MPRSGTTLCTRARSSPPSMTNRSRSDAGSSPASSSSERPGTSYRHMAGSRLGDPTTIALPTGEGPLGAWSALPHFAGDHDDAVGVIACASVRERPQEAANFAEGPRQRAGSSPAVRDQSRRRNARLPVGLLLRGSTAAEADAPWRIHLVYPAAQTDSSAGHP
jgi:hypothetical protein